jgi:penicillin-binding protein 1A
MTRRQRQLRRRKTKPHLRTKVGLGLLLLVTVTLIGGLSAVGYLVAIAATGPDIEELKPIDKGESSAVYASDGSLLGYVQSDIVRQEKPWRDLPVELRQGTVAIEDERYYEHSGVDPEGIVRAAVKNVTSGDTVQGGSTITQQLVRALYLHDPKQDIKRKIREAKLAQELEDEHSKRWILQQYLNAVPYGTVRGRTALGAEAAAQVYFSKSAKNLTLAESAMLAGLPQAPSQYNPFQNPRAAIERRNDVLQAMVDNRYVSQERATKAMEQGLGLKRSTKYERRREPYFFDYVEQLLIEKYGVAVYRRGGLKIYTTIDPKKQEQGRKAIESQLGQKGDPSSAVVSIEPKTGYIRAMASSGTYNDRTFNLAAQGHRQPGSAFKTMVLVTAIRNGVDPRRTFYTSKPLNLQIPGYGFWKVKTYGGTYGGTMDLVKATLTSDNTVYAQLDVDLGPKKVAETAHDLGITSKLEGVPSEGLGGLGQGVSPLEMARAYATLANGGKRHKPVAIRKVTFRDGKTDDSLGKSKGKQVVPDWVAYEVTKILEQNVQKGTGTKAQIGCPAAGKTGTTDNFNDAWFVGYTPDLASSVWVGYPNALREMRAVHGISVAGGTFPAQIWGSYMNQAKGSDCDDFKKPSTSPQWSAFHGKNSRTGKPRKGDDDYNAGGGGGSSAGGGGYRGYDPRLYANPPQAPPSTGSPGGRGGGGGGDDDDGGGGGGNGGGGGGNDGGGGGGGNDTGGGTGGDTGGDAGGTGTGE